jgi:cysteine-rich repeat protein
VFASADAGAGLALTKDTTLGSGEIGLSNGSAAGSSAARLVGAGSYARRRPRVRRQRRRDELQPPAPGPELHRRPRCLRASSRARAHLGAGRPIAGDWAVRRPDPRHGAAQRLRRRRAPDGEACDDGDALSDDGCSASCAVECGFSCVASARSRAARTAAMAMSPAPECDGDALPGDGCDADRRRARVRLREPEPLCDAVPATASSRARPLPRATSSRGTPTASSTATWWIGSPTTAPSRSISNPELHDQRPRAPPPRA